MNTNIQQKGNKHDVISFTTYIEIDMHGGDSLIGEDIFNWVPIIRDTLFDALQYKIDYVCFIPGKGIHSDFGIPKLLPLVIITVKTLGFNCFFEEGNYGYIVCDISSYVDPRTTQNNIGANGIRLIAVLKKHLVIENECEEDTIRNFRTQFPKIPHSSAKIICSMNDSFGEAINYAKHFEEKLHYHDPENPRNKIEKEMKKMYTNEMKTVKTCQLEYDLNQEIIERAVHEKQCNMEHIHIVLDKIVKEVPEKSFSDLVTLIKKYDQIPIETLLDALREGNYQFETVNGICRSHSMKQISGSLNIIKVDNDFQSNRPNDGSPRLIPFIKVDLRSASTQKAIKTVSRIINGLADGHYSQVDLQFASNGDSNICKQEEVIQELNLKSVYNHYNVHELHYDDEKGRYHFIISNDDIQHVSDFNDLIIFAKETNNKISPK